MSKPTFCAIIPDRGDRPKLTEFCFRQLDRMVVKPDQIYHINYPPESDGIDLVDRVYAGIDQAIKDKIQWCFVIEDDYYPKDYFLKYNYLMSRNKSILGSDYTMYYNLRNRTYNEFHHPRRASLFTTAFRPVDAIIPVRIWRDKSASLDVRMWAAINDKGYVHAGAIGMKHLIGKCAGKGHNWDMDGKDKDLNHLSDILHDDREAFEFYKSLSEEIYK